MKKIIFTVLLLLIFPIGVFALNEPKIASLDISGVDYEFNPNKTTYNISYYNRRTPVVNITATPSTSGSQITGTGSVTLNEGDNVIKLNVSNGTASNEYTLNINFSYDGSNINGAGSNTGNPNTGDVNITTYTLIAIGSLVLLVYLRSKRKLMELNNIN